MANIYLSSSSLKPVRFLVACSALSILCMAFPSIASAYEDPQQPQLSPSAGGYPSVPRSIGPASDDATPLPTQSRTQQMQAQPASPMADPAMERQQPAAPRVMEQVVYPPEQQTPPQPLQQQQP